MDKVFEFFEQNMRREQFPLHELMMNDGMKRNTRSKGSICMLTDTVWSLII